MPATKNRLPKGSGFLVQCVRQFSVSDTVVLCVTVLLVPVIVSTNVPVPLFRLVVMVSVDEPVPVTELGENVALARFGNPDTLNATLPLKPLLGVTVTV